MGENVAMEGFVGFKVAIKVAILGALFSAMVAAETQHPSFEEYKQIKRDEIQTIIDQHNAKGLPLTEASYTHIGPYRQDSFEYPLIFEVVMFGTPEQLDTMITAGADVNALFPGGHPGIPPITPIYFANNGYHPYRATAWFECRPDQARRLLAAGARIEQPSFNSYSLLGRYTAPSMFKGCAETLSLLIEEGADVNAQDILGRTALSDALQVNDINGVELLLAAGADPNLQDITGLSVFEHALQMTLSYLPMEDSKDSQPNTLRRFIELAVDKKYEENIDMLRQQRDAQGE